MKVAVAQAVAVRHIDNPGEKVVLSRLIEKLGRCNAVGKPHLEISELCRLMNMNTQVQVNYTFDVTGSFAGVVQHLLGERGSVYPVEHQPPATSDLRPLVRSRSLERGVQVPPRPREWQPPGTPSAWLRLICKALVRESVLEDFGDVVFVEFHETMADATLREKRVKKAAARGNWS